MDVARKEEAQNPSAIFDGPYVSALANGALAIFFPLNGSPTPLFGGGHGLSPTSVSSSSHTLLQLDNFTGSVLFIMSGAPAAFSNWLA